MYIRIIHVLVSIFILFVFACQSNKEKNQYSDLNTLSDSIGKKHVPDKRDNVYDIQITDKNGTPLVKGVTSVAEAKKDLLEQLRKIHPTLIDSIILLPDTALGDSIYGIINVSVADLRTQNEYSAEMSTQVLLGAPVQVLQQDDWWRVKTAEGYVAWLTGNSFTRMTKKEFNEWINGDRIIFTNDFGFAYGSPNEKGERVSDLVYGNILKLESSIGSFYKVIYPDKREAYILKTQSMPYKEWVSSRSLSEESILEKALSLKGIPYVWGGTSTKGMDCSGFTKTVLLMHGIILTRDASQQAKTGIPVDITNGYDKLRPGDLMFFGKKGENGKKDRIRHVAFYKGGKEFIHASGYIKINSLDSTKSNYDARNTHEFISATRIIGAVDTKGIWNIENNPLYKEQK